MMGWQETSKDDGNGKVFILKREFMGIGNEQWGEM
jgi:hypothetical protein